MSAGFLDSIRQHRAAKADAHRWAAMSDRFAKHFENALGPARMRALRLDACKDVREAYVRAATAFCRAMNECDGGMESVVMLGNAGTAYTAAYLAAFERAAELAEAGG